MRLSDAIAMGRVLVPKLEATRLEGCALGMAGRAMGFNLNRNNYNCFRAAWPWLTKPYTGPLFRNLPEDPEFTWLRAVYTRFDSEVMRSTLTLDELIDWVRANEPPEPGEPSTPEQEVSLRIQSIELSSIVLA